MATLVCEECCAAASDGNPAIGWSAYLADLDDDGHDEVAVFCPDCVEREFAPASSGRRGEIESD